MAKASERTAAEIRAVIDDWAEGMRRKDAARVMTHGAAGFLHFSLAPSLIAEDTGAEGLNAWFDTWLGPIEFEIADLEITAGEDVAFCTSINRLAGTKTDGETNEIWLRQTLGLEKQNGAWKIAHLHESVPFYMDGSLRAAVDLKP
jgi:PhnB protein